MPVLVGSIAAILLLGLILDALRQPLVVAYLLAGVALGPSGLGVMTDQVAIGRLGEVGVVLLLFFIGMEIKLPEFVARWKAPVVGTLLQIGISVGVVWGIGVHQGWPLGRSVLLGLVISLSSTAVVMKLLQSKGEMTQPIGRDVVGVLLVQDLAIVPMMIAIAVLGGASPDPTVIAGQVVGGALTIAVLVYVATRQQLRLRLDAWFRDNHELQVFGAGLLCFGLALATGLAGLSAALGAFVGGVIVGAARETEWIHEALFPFHVLLLALFFVSVGMMIDLEFLRDNLTQVGILLGLVVVLNTAVNTLIFRVLGRTWPNSLYGGAALSQIGEFSFVLAAAGLQTGLIHDYGYRMTVIVIALSLLLSPMWIAAMDRRRRAAAATS